MTTFVDDFNRADGDLGNGWSYGTNVPQIISQQLRPPSTQYCTREFGAGDYVRAGIDLLLDTSPSSAHGGVSVKAAPTGVYGYNLTVSGTRPNLTITLIRRHSGGSLYLVNAGYTWNGGAWLRLELEYDAGALAIYVDGALWRTATNNDLAANTYVGLPVGYSTLRYDNFECADAPSATFDAEPEPLTEMAIPEEVTFTGTDTAWEPGTPGQPIFEVDKGTLDSQTITSATTASAMYTPPQATDVATFTDPSTGLTDQIALSTGFQVDGGEGLSEDAVAYVEASAAQNGGSPGVILSTNTPITPYGTGISLDLINARLYAWVNTMAGDVPQSPPSEGLLYKLWRILNGGDEPDVDDNVFDAAMSAWASAANAETGIVAWRTGSAYTAQDILDAIEATIPPDLSELEAQLAAIRTGELLTLADPIAAVEAARGSGLPTIHDVLDAVAAIRTANNYTLASVYGWINSAIGPVVTAIGNLSTLITGLSNYVHGAVMDAIHAIGGADNIDLTEIHDQVGQLNIDMVSHFGHVDSAIAGVRGLDARDLTEVYDAILDLPQEQVSLQPVLNAISALSASVTQSRDAILAAIAAIRPADYPLWPGAGAAELGVPVSGTGDLAIPGPLDGLLIDVTTYPTEIRAWTVAGRVGLKWAGHVTFVSDIGYTEEIQFPGTDKRVLVPKSMLTCASALVHLRPGVQATVTPWYYAP